MVEEINKPKALEGFLPQNAKRNMVLRFNWSVVLRTSVIKFFSMSTLLIELLGENSIQKKKGLNFGGRYEKFCVDETSIKIGKAVLQNDN